MAGSDTWIKIGGFLRADLVVNSNSVYRGNTSGAGGAGNRFSNAFTSRSRTELSIDTRTATEYGLVRTYSTLTFIWTGDTYAGTGTGGTVYSLNPGTTNGTAPGNGSSGGSGLGTLGVYYAFIQFAGFTM